MTRSLRPWTLLALLSLTAVSLAACGGADDHVHDDGTVHKEGDGHK